MQVDLGHDNMGNQTSAMDALGNVSTTIYNAVHPKLEDQDQLGYLTSYGSILRAGR
jgi:hypothetical protein